MRLIASSTVEEFKFYIHVYSTSYEDNQIIYMYMYMYMYTCMYNLYSDVTMTTHLLTALCP